MAFYKNREVALLGPVDGASASPTYAILHKDNQREHVALDQIQLTNEEFENLRKQHGEHGMYGVSKIEDKDAQELRDSQDRVKIEKAQGEQDPLDRPVPVSKVMVDPKEVAATAPNSSLKADADVKNSKKAK